MYFLKNQDKMQAMKRETAYMKFQISIDAIWIIRNFR